MTPRILTTALVQEMLEDAIFEGDDITIDVCEKALAGNVGSWEIVAEWYGMAAR